MAPWPRAPVIPQLVDRKTFRDNRWIGWGSCVFPEGSVCSYKPSSGELDYFEHSANSPNAALQWNINQHSRIYYTALNHRDGFPGYCFRATILFILDHRRTDIHIEENIDNFKCDSISYIRNSLLTGLDSTDHSVKEVTRDEFDYICFTVVCRFKQRAQ
ncbi:hypothetical protein TNCV_3246801 [Trichonephila clavipes]|nr:hypothetical protein TNCV_3246801 [Trichonephila clavipes]